MDGQVRCLRADRDPRGVTLGNWQDPPFNRWAFLHLDELLTVATISCGSGTARELRRAERYPDGLEDLVFEAHGERRTVGQMLEETFTDAFLVLRDGQVAMEQYADGMSEDTLHLTMTVSKSLTSALAGVLVGQGLLDAAALVPDYVDELRGTSFQRCTVQHLLDMRAGTKWSEDYGAFTESDAFACEQVMGWRPREAPGMATGCRRRVAKAQPAGRTLAQRTTQARSVPSSASNNRDRGREYGPEQTSSRHRAAVFGHHGVV